MDRSEKRREFKPVEKNRNIVPQGSPAGGERKQGQPQEKKRSSGRDNASGGRVD